MSELLGMDGADESAPQSPCPSGLAATVNHSCRLRHTSTAVLNKNTSSLWLGAFNLKWVLINIVLVVEKVHLLP